MTKDNDLLKRLTLRGATQIIEPSQLDRQLASGKKLVIKYGIDPTAGRIHIGRAATIRHLKHFQDLGHQIHIIIGSFTAQIGDSSDKDAERKALTPEQVASNMASYEKQFARVLDVSKVKFSYNGDWFDQMSLAEFFKLQQLFSVAQMIERDNFAKRYKAGKRIGLHEFSYALLQGYDSVAIKADIEIGGTDQLFNILAGRTVQKAYDIEPQSVIVYELLLGLDGRKMSTSWGNCIYVDDAPEDMYGKVMSIADELMWDYFRLVTELDDKELADIEAQIKQGDDPRSLKARLAKEITALYHSQELAKKAEDEFNNRFQDGQLPTDIEEVKVCLGSNDLINLLVEADLAPSRSESRRLIDQGSVKLNQTKVETVEISVSAGDVLQVGKHRFKRLISK